MTRNCIECGASLDGQEAVRSHLSDLGYRHRDDRINCPECGHGHTFGVPLDRATEEPPACPVCGGRAYPYKIDFGADSVKIDVHWKCEECFYFHRYPVVQLEEDVYSLQVNHLLGWTEADHE